MHHFPRRLVCESQEEDAVGGNPLLQQVRDSIGQRAGLAGTGPGENECRPRQRGDGGVLLPVEFARVVNLQIDRTTKGLKNIVTRHRRHLSVRGPGRENHFMTGAAESRRRRERFVSMQLR